MLTAVAVIASLGFIGWLIYRGVKQKSVRAHTVTRGITYVVGIYTFAFFLGMDIPQLVRVVVSILLGAALIVLAAYIQRRHQTGKS